jgi:hypothetical protein
MIRRHVSQREVDGLLLQLKGLVLVRALLEDRGVSKAEIDQHTAEIERLQARLAELAPRSDDCHRAAA